MSIDFTSDSTMISIDFRVQSLSLSLSRTSWGRQSARYWRALSLPTRKTNSPRVSRRVSATFVGLLRRRVSPFIVRSSVAERVRSFFPAFAAALHFSAAGRTSDTVRAVSRSLRHGVETLARQPRHNYNSSPVPPGAYLARVVSTANI